MVQTKSELDAIFHQHRGNRELAKHLDEYMNGQRKVGKAVNVVSYFNGINNAIEKALEYSDNNYESLHMCLKILAQVQGRTQTKFIQLGVPKVFNKTLQFTDIEESSRCSILETLQDIITATADRSVEAKNAFKSFVPVCFGLIMDEKKMFQVRIEAVKFLNSVIESYGKHGGYSGPIESLPFIQNFETLLTGAGDVELQLSIVELVFRFLNREERLNQTDLWFQCYHEVREKFSSIRDEEFEQDCRTFINSLNEKQLENRRAYSLSCKAAYLGTFKVDCPKDDGSDEFWTDFNLGSESISFFACTENGGWETVVIRCEYVTETKLLDKKEEGQIAVILKLNRTVDTLLLACPETKDSYVKFLYSAENSPIKPLSLLFTLSLPPTLTSLSPDFVASTPPKASVAINAVHLSSRSKGYTKTVPMMTPKRKSEDRVSSADSGTDANAPSTSARDTKGERDKQDTPGQSVVNEDDMGDTESHEVSQENERPVEELVEIMEDVDAGDIMENGGELGNDEDHTDKVVSDKEKDSRIRDTSGVELEDSVNHMGVNGDHKSDEVIDDGDCVVVDGMDAEDHRGQTGKLLDQEDNFTKVSDSHESGLDAGDKDPRDSDVNAGLSSTQEVTTKAKRGKAVKGRVTRSKTLPKRGRAKNSGPSTSESEYNERIVKTREKKKEKEKSKSTAPKTRSSSNKESDTKSVLGTGYNTEDWVFGESEYERRQEKKKVLDRTETDNSSKQLSQSRLSLIKNAFKKTYQAGRMQKSLDPFEFKCSPPPKKTKTGLTLLRSAKITYAKLKERQRNRKREKRLERSRLNGDVDVIPDSQLPYETATYSDFAAEIKWTDDEDDDDEEEVAKKRSRSESELLKNAERQRWLKQRNMKELLEDMNDETTVKSGGGKVARKKQPAGDGKRRNRKSGSEKEIENEESTGLFIAEDEPDNMGDMQFNEEADPKSRHSEPDNNLTQDYMARNQNDDVTVNEPVSGLNATDHDDVDPLGELINEYLGEIPGNLLNENHGEDPRKSSDEVGISERRGHHGINQDTEDDGGNKARGHRGINKDSEEDGSSKARGHGGINPDAEDDGGSKARGRHGINKGSEEDGGSKARGHRRINKDSEEDGGSKARGHHGINKGSEEDGGSKARGHGGINPDTEDDGGSKARGHRGINKDSEDDGGSKARGHRGINKDSEEDGGTEAKGHRGINPDTEDDGGSKARGHRGINKDSDEDGGSKARGHRVTNEDTKANSGSKARGRHGSNKDSEDDVGGKARGRRGSTEDTENKGGSTRKDRAKARGDHETNEDSEDNSASKARGHPAVNVDTGDSGGSTRKDRAKAKGHRGVNEDTDDNGGDARKDDATVEDHHGITGEPKRPDKTSKTFAAGNGRGRKRWDHEEDGEDEVERDEIIQPVLIISDEEDNDVQPARVTRSKTHVGPRKAENSSSFENNTSKPKAAVEKREGPKVRRPTATQRREQDGEETDENDLESEEETVSRKSPRLKEKTFQKLVEETLLDRNQEENEAAHMTEDDVNVIEVFKNNLAKIIGDSRQQNFRKTPSPRSSKKKAKTSRPQETTVSKNTELLTKSKSKTSLKTSRETRTSHEHWEEEPAQESVGKQKKIKERTRRASPEGKETFNANPFEFDIRTPKVDRCRTADSGFFDKTPASSCKKRTVDSRGQTAGSTRPRDRRDGTPEEHTKKQRRFGWLDVTSGASCSNKERRRSSFEQEDAPESPDEHNFTFPVLTGKKPFSSTTGMKRKERAEEKVGLVSGPFSVQSTRRRNNQTAHPEDEREEDDDEEDTIDKTNFQTPEDASEFVPIQPRKLFRSGDWSAQISRKTKASKPAVRQEQADAMENQANEDERLTEGDDDVSIGDEVQLTLASLGKNMQKTIRKRQNYVNQMANSSMKLITSTSQQMWSRHSSKRKKLLCAYAHRVNGFIQDHQQISARKRDIENEMLSQLMKHLENVSTQRKDQEKCLQNIVKTQEAFSEAFHSLEDDSQSEQESLQSSLRNELLQFRDQVVNEVQKQEVGNIRRRIQAMIGAPL